MTDREMLIDANALMEHLNRCIEQSKGLMRSVCVAIKCFVVQMPTVDAVEVVHARWHDVYLLSPWVATGVCGHCKLTSYINPDFPHAKHCPNCGAKMDGGNEDGV